MIEQRIDLWEVEADVRCITTNGTVTRDGENIMGGGCAGEAAQRMRWLPRSHGQYLSRFGQHCYLIGDVVMFPTKRTVREAADLTLIAQSAMELVMLQEIYLWERVAIPQPGTGLGGLKWDDVRAVLEPILYDDLFVIVSYPDGRE